MTTRSRTSNGGFSVLVFCFILMTLTGVFLFGLWQYQTMDLNMTTRIMNKRIAEDAARSALAWSYAKLEDREWGKKGEALILEDPTNPGAFGYVSFRYNGPDPEKYEPTPEESKALEQAGVERQSLNNLGGQNSVLGFDGMTIPPNACVVVAVGKYRNVEQVAYQIHIGSPLPYSLASEGALKVSGDTVVGGLDSLVSAQELPKESLSTDKLSDSGVVSNDVSGDAVDLSGNIKVVGDVASLGGVRRDPQVDITGAVKKLDNPVGLPDIRLSDYDPKGDPSNPNDDLATLVERTESVVPDAVNNPLYGFQRFPGNVSFPDGLKLDGSGVFIDGDVVLDGPLEGSGLLVATGSITLKGGADMKADVLAAVIAGGDLTVNGALQAANSGHSSFQGLLYSKGDLTLSNTRTVGTVVSASDATGQPGKLVIQDSQVISTPDTSDFRLVIKAFGPQQQGGLGAQTQQHQGSGNGWELLEPNPADLLSQDAGGKPVFVWDDSHLKIRIQQPDGSWRVISTPEEALANGLDPAGGEFDSLKKAYDKLRNLWANQRVKKLNEEYKKELVDVIHFDLNEFLKVSSRLKAKKVYFKD